MFRALKKRRAAGPNEIVIYEKTTRKVGRWRERRRKKEVTCKEGRSGGGRCPTHYEKSSRLP